MSSETMTSLSRVEQRLIFALRELPEGSLRELCSALVAELADLGSHPTCPEAQADGVPCASAETSCDECRKVEALVRELRARVRAA